MDFRKPSEKWAKTEARQNDLQNCKFSVKRKGVTLFFGITPFCRFKKALYGTPPFLRPAFPFCFDRPEA